MINAIALASVLAASPASAGQLEQFSADLQSLEAEFTQQVFDDAGRLLEESRGTFSLRAPKYLSWQYRQPYEQLIVADGHRVWLYDVDLEQITVKAQDTAAASSPLYLLADYEALQHHYQINEQREGSRTVVSLLPQDDQAQFERIDFIFDNGHLQGLHIADAVGQDTVMTFHGLQINQEMPMERFRFVPPAGIDIIREDSDSGDPIDS